MLKQSVLMTLGAATAVMGMGPATPRQSHSQRLIKSSIRASKHLRARRGRLERIPIVRFSSLANRSLKQLTEDV